MEENKDSPICRINFTVFQESIHVQSSQAPSSVLSQCSRIQIAVDSSDTHDPYEYRSEVSSRKYTKDNELDCVDAADCLTLSSN